MKFSVFTVSIPDYNLEDTLKKLKEYGYDGVEWRVTRLSEATDAAPQFWTNNKSTVDITTIEENAESLKTLCKKYDIEITALATYLSLDQPIEVEKVLRAAVIMGCPKIRVNVPSYNGKVNYNEVFAKAIEDIKILEKLAEKYNVKINFEIHMNNIIPTASAAYRLVSGFNSKYIGIIHDAGNMVHEGFEQYKFGVELLGDYLDHVHIKNARSVVKEVDENGVSVWATEWCSLKKGQVNFNNLFEALKSVGYDKWLSFEDFSEEVSIDERLRENIKFIKSML